MVMQKKVSKYLFSENMPVRKSVPYSVQKNLPEMFYEKLLWIISQNSPENTSARICFY